MHKQTFLTNLKQCEIVTAYVKINNDMGIYVKISKKEALYIAEQLHQAEIECQMLGTELRIN